MMAIDTSLLVRVVFLLAAALLFWQSRRLYSELLQRAAQGARDEGGRAQDGITGRLPWRKSAFLTSDLPAWHLNTSHMPSSHLLLSTHEHGEHARARACLAGRHLLLVGDSLTRYQYLNLAFFLRSGEWSSPAPRSEWEADHGGGDWPSFYACTQARNGASPAVPDSPCAHRPAGEGGSGGYSIAANTSEICDCLRTQDAGGGIAEAHEARYLLDHGTGGRVTYLQLWSSRALDWFAPAEVGVGCMAQQHRAAWLRYDRSSSVEPRAFSHAPAPAPACPQTGCTPGACTSPPHKGVPAFQALLQQAEDPLLQPIDLLVMNSGLWGTFDRGTALSSLLPTLDSIAARSRGVGCRPRIVWKTTTAVAPGTEQPYEAETLQAWSEHVDDDGGPWGVFDTFSLTHPLAQAVALSPALEAQVFTNPKHYQPWVYRELNRALLHELCG